MLLTITSTTPPATDLGFLLHKHPSRTQSFKLGFGQAHVFYPEATPDRCTAALLLDVDPVGLVRGRGSGPSHGSDQDGAQYVSDRPYVASSFLSVAIGEVFGTALGGRSRDRAELAQMQLPLDVRMSVVPARGGESTLRRLFEPLGYEVTARPLPLDEQFPDWGESRYLSVELRGNVRVRDLLAHLCVLIPVLDDRKHYYVGDDEVEKLLRRGEGWLATHPQRGLITERYLKHRRNLVRDALDRLEPDEAEDEGDEIEAGDAIASSLAGGATDSAMQPDGMAAVPVGLGLAPPALDLAPPALDLAPSASTIALSAGSGSLPSPARPLSLHEQRITAVMASLKEYGAHSVLDLGCGEGRLLRELLSDRTFERIVGLDVSYRSLERAKARLRLDRLPPRQAERITLIHGALTYRDRRLAGFDAAAVVEVVEHLDPPRLSAFARVLFEHARPGCVVLTTPNVEHNVRYPGLTDGHLRHADHRFEWTREQFQGWATTITMRFGYGVRFYGVGLEDPEVGPPSQMAVFTR